MKLTVKRFIPLAAACAALLALSACQDGRALTDATPAVTPQPTAPASMDVRTGWVYGADGKPMEVTFIVEQGLAIYQGDIKLGPVEKVAKTREELTRAGGPRFGIVVDGSGLRWPSGTVPYMINSGFTATQRQVILDAMSMVQSSVGGISFKPRTTESNFVLFLPHADWCISDLGRVGGGQAIELTADCANHKGKVAHEILHALGMDHEQSRCDRDTYVTVDASKALSKYYWAFVKNCADFTDLFEYDESSMTHWGAYEQSANGQPPITSKRGLAHLMGQRISLSQTDVRTLNYIYRPYPPQGYNLATANGQTVATWNPSGGATHYAVRLIERYEYHDNYAGNSWTQENTLATYTVTGTSASLGPHTQGTCVVYDDGYTTEQYVYELELQAHFPDGVVGWVGRYASVGPC